MREKLEAVWIELRKSSEALATVQRIWGANVKLGPRTRNSWRILLLI